MNKYFCDRYGKEIKIPINTIEFFKIGSFHWSIDVCDDCLADIEKYALEKPEKVQGIVPGTANGKSYVTEDGNVIKTVPAEDNPLFGQEDVVKSKPPTGGLR